MFRNKFNSDRYISKAVKSFFEGEGDAAAGTQQTTAATAAVTPPPAQGTQTQTAQVFTQEHVNRLMAQEKDRNRQSTQKIITELETLKQNQNLSEQEKQSLTTRIDELNATLQTKEQLAASELQKLQKKYETDTSTFKQQADVWKNRFESKLKSVDIYAAASQYDAFDNSQIEAIIAPKTKVVEEIGDDGKPTGQLTTRVDFDGVDKDDKPVKLNLSVAEAVKAMTEMQRYGNLFKNKATSGLGMNPVGNGLSNGRIPDIDSMTPEQYKKNRPAIRSEMAKNK